MKANKQAACQEVPEFKIDLSTLSAKEIVRFVLKHVEKGNVWVRTGRLSCISKEKWLVFKKKEKGSALLVKDYRSKRAMDIILGSIFFIVSLPIFFVTFLLVKISSKGPAIFRQPRVDNNKRVFELYKFRTMKWDGGEEIHQNYMKQIIGNPDLKQKAYKLINDPRTTAIGKWIRRLSLDELPQLINVIKGDMSLVGPRPPIPYEVESYKDWHFARFYAKPGLTGLWQVMGRSLIPFDEMVVLDLYYAFNQSFWLDVKILLRTIPMVLSLKGAF